MLTQQAIPSPPLSNKQLLAFFAMTVGMFMGQLLDGRVVDPEKVSYFLLANNINKEAFVIAINSIFGIISALFFMVMLFLPFTSTVRGGKGYDAH